MFKKFLCFSIIFMFIFLLPLNSIAQQDESSTADIEMENVELPPLPPLSNDDEGSTISTQKMEYIKLVIKNSGISDFINLRLPESIRKNAYDYAIKATDAEFSEDELKSLCDFLNTNLGNKSAIFSTTIRDNLLNYMNVN